MDVKIFSPKDYTDKTWSGGTVQQLFILPKDSDVSGQDFLLRLSFTHITAETANIPLFPNVDRLSMVVDNSVKVEPNGKKAFTLHPFKPYTFSGDDETTVNGKCTSFNVMLRHGSYEKADLFVNDASAFDLYPYDGDCYLYVSSGSYEMVTPDDKCILNKDSLVHLSDIRFSKIRRLDTSAKMIILKLKW